MTKIHHTNQTPKIKKIITTFIIAFLSYALLAIFPVIFIEDFTIGIALSTGFGFSVGFTILNYNNYF
jgi:hypothetical protein